MAGEVRCRKFGVDAGRPMIDPDICPAASGALHSPSCLKASMSDGHENWCPFAMALILRRAGTTYDLDRGSSVRVWMTDYGSDLDDWSCICLRKESAGTQPGAVLRP